MQWSVYVRHCASRESADAQASRVRRALPPAGEVRMFRLTDRQYEAMEVFWGSSRKRTEQPPQQLEFF
jgi:CRISPR-associated protein Cas2